MGSNAAGDAAQAAQQAAATGNTLLQGATATNTANLQPFIGSGQIYNSALEGLLGVGGNPAASQSAFSNYLGSTNYQFQLGQGEQAIESANAPAFSSGATAKALNNYAQGQAGSALAGYEGLLQTGAAQGESAASVLGVLTNQSALGQSANLNAAAGVTANADIYGSSALTNALRGGVSGLSSFGNSASNGWNNFVGGLLGGT